MIGRGPEAAEVEALIAGAAAGQQRRPPGRRASRASARRRCCATPASRASGAPRARGDRLRGRVAPGVRRARRPGRADPRPHRRDPRARRPGAERRAGARPAGPRPTASPRTSPRCACWPPRPSASRCCASSTTPTGSTPSRSRPSSSPAGGSWPTASRSLIAAREGISPRLDDAARSRAGACAAWPPSTPRSWSRTTPGRRPTRR